MKKLNWPLILEWALVLNVCFKLFIYGTGKILGGQFYLKGKIPQEIGMITLAETGSYNLAWTFFGHSMGYILFIGISQIVGAILFAIPRTRLIGGAILIPILLNIIVVDYFYGVAYGALFSACFYLASILWVFYVYRGKVIAAFKQLVSFERKKERRKRLLPILMIILGVAVVFTAEYLGIEFFGYEDR